MRKDRSSGRLRRQHRPRLSNNNPGLVSVPVSFIAVRMGSVTTPTAREPQFRTCVNAAGHCRGDLESVLGATPHEFESRILRRCLSRQTSAPTTSAVGADVFRLAANFLMGCSGVVHGAGDCADTNAVSVPRYRGVDPTSDGPYTREADRSSGPPVPEARRGLDEAGQRVHSAGMHLAAPEDQRLPFESRQVRSGEAIRQGLPWHGWHPRRGSACGSGRPRPGRSHSRRRRPGSFRCLGARHSSLPLPCRRWFRAGVAARSHPARPGCGGTRVASGAEEDTGPFAAARLKARRHRLPRDP
ncbi:hypothetical protein KAURM247S_03762 [Kitasatospora aureofaciens]